MTNTAGYAKLLTLISALTGASNGLEQAIFRRWYQRRFAVIENDLTIACKDASVRVFFDEYAGDLAAQLEAVLPEGPLIEPAQTAIDYIEGLYIQTQRFAQAVNSSRPLPETEPVEQPMAMAA